MKLIVFFQKIDNNLVECVGGDSIIVPDGRFSINTIIKRLADKNYFYPPREATHYTINEGSIRHNTPLTNHIKL